MTDRDNERIERIHRVSFPTASFSLARTHIRWIAERALALGVSKSEVVRELVEKAMRDEERAA